MVEQFFRDPRVITRLRSTPLGSAMDDLAEYLEKRGHAQVTVRDYLRGAAHFGYWTAAEGIAVSEVHEEVVARFLQEHVPQCRCPVPRGLPLKQLSASTGHLLKVLRDSGRTAGPTAALPIPVDLVVKMFKEPRILRAPGTPSTCTRSSSPTLGRGPLTSLGSPRRM